ncbi:MAG: BamA/TamA family outer membrane protein [Methylococcales bacterium]|nr:BamA/TamA family outer membrane protein [Methylococcales bacterium]
MTAGPCRLLPALLIILTLCLPAAARAADPQPYSVHLGQTDNDRLNQLLQDASILISLQKTADVGPFALLARAREDQGRFEIALQSLGYYKGKAVLTIGGRNLDDPELFDWLSQAPAQPPVTVEAAFEPGPQFHLGRISLEGDAPPRVKDDLKLKTGDKAVAADVQAARERLLKALLNQGHALAKVAEPVATLNPQTNSVDILFQVDSGPVLKLGKIGIEGLQKVNLAFVRQRLLITDGQQFDENDIEKARQDLAGLGIFSSVRTDIAKQLDSQGRVPLSFDVAERPRHAVNAGAAYSTDVGGSLSGSWMNRNLLGNAEQLSLTTAVTQLGGNSTTGIGYKAGAAFSKPDFQERDQSLQLGLDAIQQSLIAYNTQSVMAHMALNRKLDAHWQATYGLAAQQEQIVQEGVSRDYTLLSLPLTLKYDSSNSPLDPSKGSIASASLTPTESLSVHADKPFVLMQVSASTYFDLADSGRSVLALRGLLGDSGGASQFELPPDKRFYAGGSATVRGYKYQSIGPAFADSKPQGGTAMAAGSVELRQRILEDYGVVMFADAGQVSVNALPFANKWLIGAGIGARYYTSFGPIRLDVALPVNPQPGSGSFELYVGLGQAF